MEDLPTAVLWLEKLKLCSEKSGNIVQCDTANKACSAPKTKDSAGFEVETGIMRLVSISEASYDGLIDDSVHDTKQLGCVLTANEKR